METGINSPSIKALEDQIAALKKDNKFLHDHIDSLVARIRHLLQSETVRLFDEYDPKTGTYKRDIRRLDTYGVHYKVLEYEKQQHSPNSVLDDFQALLYKANCEGKKQEEIARLFDKERKWATQHINYPLPFRVDYGFSAGLSALGYELKIVKKGGPGR